MVLDDCSGAIVQYYYDDSCSNLVGISGFATNGETCQLENHQSLLHVRLKCTTHTGRVTGGRGSSNSDTGIIESFSQVLGEYIEYLCLDSYRILYYIYYNPYLYHILYYTILYYTIL